MLIPSVKQPILLIIFPTAKALSGDGEEGNGGRQRRHTAENALYLSWHTPSTFIPMVIQLLSDILSCLLYDFPFWHAERCLLLPRLTTLPYHPSPPLQGRFEIPIIPCFVFVSLILLTVCVSRRYPVVPQYGKQNQPSSNFSQTCYCSLHANAINIGMKPLDPNGWYLDKIPDMLVYENTLEYTNPVLWHFTNSVNSSYFYSRPWHKDWGF